jgi:hypothetical protein
MTINQLRQLHEARPFRLFSLRLADGSRVKVPHPEFMWIHPGGRTVHVAVDDDAARIVDVFLVIALETGNGTVRGRRKQS